MVEAAIALPMLMLIILSMIMVMVHYVDSHQAQLRMHRELACAWDKPTVIFDIQQKQTETSSKISGVVDLLVRRKKESRVYVFSPARCIRLGEMLSFDEE